MATSRPRILRDALLRSAPQDEGRFLSTVRPTSPFLQPLQQRRVDLARIGVAEVVDLGVGHVAPPAISACSAWRASCTGNIQSSRPCTMWIGRPRRRSPSAASTRNGWKDAEIGARWVKGEPRLEPADVGECAAVAHAGQQQSLPGRRSSGRAPPRGCAPGSACRCRRPSAPRCRRSRSARSRWRRSCARRAASSTGTRGRCRCRRAAPSPAARRDRRV